MSQPERADFLSARVLIPFVIVTLIWGSTWIVIKDQLGVVPPSWSVAYRFGVAAIAMFMLVALRREPLLLDRRTLLFAALLGLAQFSLNFNLVYRAEGYITSGVVSVIFALLMVPNAILSRLFLGTPIARRFLIGGTISTVGIAMLLWHEASQMTGDPHAVLIGTALTLTGMLGASCANVMQASPMGRAAPMMTMVAWAMLTGALCDAAIAWATVGPPVIDTRPGYIGGVLYLALAGSVITFPLYFGIIRNIGAGPAAWSSVLIPIIAMALSTLAEGYSWTGLAVAGAIFAIAGIIWAVRPEPARTLNA